MLRCSGKGFPGVSPQRTHRARNCDVTVRVSRQLTVLVPVRQQAKCEAKHWFSHWLHSKWKVLKKHIKREIALLKHFFSPYNIEISNLYSYHFFKYWNFDMLWFLLFLCPNGKLGCCSDVRQVAVFTSTAIQSRIPPLGVCSVVTSQISPRHALNIILDPNFMSRN